MKVTDHLASSKNPCISVEIIPPRRGGNVQQIHQAIETILPFNPPFIDVTSHAAEVIWEEMPDGTFKKRVKRKSPGTFGLCAAIKYKYNIDPVPHILCAGFSKEETEDALIELNYLGVENLLCIKGDNVYQRPVPEGKTANTYALDLVQQVDRMNQGRYLDESLIDAAHTDFCIGVSCYPEKHFEAPNLKFDIQNLKNKVDAGAHYAVSQMFFDNSKYFEYVEVAKEMGITVPIIPGLKILTSKKQLTTIPKVFYINLPDELVDKVMACKDDKEVRAVGVDWALKQSLELLEKGAPSLHFYIMQNTGPFLALMEKLAPKL
jgi:methylenetetrahydrofolate reductase (NADPH)